MLCVITLERHGLAPDAAGGLPVLVTGAAGGVGSVAVCALSQLGYDVVALSGRTDQSDYLRKLGAREIVERSELADAPPRALERERWAGGVDVVGGRVLAAMLRQTRYRGCVAACGLAGGPDLVTTVHPFILRGVDLAGVESVRCPTELRVEAWKRLAANVPFELLEEMTSEVPLEGVVELGEEIIAGRTRGRVVVAVNP
jgi:acrylyl-CoA reductase (NADPH)